MLVTREVTRVTREVLVTRVTREVLVTRDTRDILPIAQCGQVSN
jgi:hypothetical protein